MTPLPLNRGFFCDARRINLQSDGQILRPPAIQFKLWHRYFWIGKIPTLVNPIVDSLKTINVQWHRSQFFSHLPSIICNFFIDCSVCTYDTAYVIRDINRREYLNRKSERPFDESKAMHIVMRTHLKGALHIRTIRTWIRGYVPLLAHKNGICLYHFAIEYC